MREKVFGTAAEKQRAYRERKRGGVTIGSKVTPKVTDVTIHPNVRDDIPLSVYADGEIMTETDRQFEAKHPGYYVFEKVERDVQCHFCHKKFRTRMMLLRFCSPECQHEKLKSFSTVGMLAGKEN